MPITVLCPSCGKQLSAPDSAAGKQAKCPKCGTLMQIPEAVVEAEEVADDLGLGMQAPAGGFSDEDLDDSYGISDDAPGQQPEDPQRRPCPACGEMIVQGAAKCRFCGEIFDALLRQQASRMQHSDANSDLTTGDWVLAILCAKIGCIIGIVWMIQGKPKGGKMVGISLLFVFLWNVLVGIIMSLGGAP